jgi:hypothetical protein
MGALMSRCPKTGDKISLGVELDCVTFDRTPDFVATFYCESCAVDHPWSKTDAWIEATEFKQQARKKTARVPPRTESLRGGTWSFTRVVPAESRMPFAA